MSNNQSAELMSRILRVASWNIRHGGGSNERVTRTLLGFDADVLVVPEFRTGPTGLGIVQLLVASGYYVSYPPSVPGKNSVMIASRRPITAAGTLDGSFPEHHRLWRVNTYDLSIVGVYIPGGIIKIQYWEAIIRAASAHNRPDLFIGDFNTGTNDLDKDPRGSPFIAPEYMDRMTAVGFVDLWRARYPASREYTWFSPQGGNGFRLDHVFGTTALHRHTLKSRYDHAPRLSGASDHSAIMVDFRTAGAQGTMEPVGHVYAFADPGCPNLLKIGKDHKWPLRFRQAQSHTPRGMTEVGRWPVFGDLRTLTEAERKARSLFPREPTSPGREWVRTSPSEAIERICAILGTFAPQSPSEDLPPFDDWRDWERPQCSRLKRRIWIGCERETGRLKVVHSPHITRFHKLCPTYSRHGIEWLEAWGWPDHLWQPTTKLHPLDARLVDLWATIVTSFGFGPRDPRLGWLQEGIEPEDIRKCLQVEGLQYDLSVQRAASDRTISTTG